MAETKPKAAPQEKAAAPPDPPAAAGLAALQAATDEAEQKGYIGTVPDETPNRNYTVAGVTEGAPTPETEEVRKA